VDPSELRFTTLYHAHYDTIYHYALRRADHYTAEEVVSETFTIAWRRLADVPADDAAVRAWLLGVARRVLANAARSSRRAGQLSARLQEHRPSPASPDVAAGIAERERVLRALELLADRDREAMKLIGWDDLSVAEAAAVLGCSRTALAVRLHRARQRLRRTLGDADEARTAGRGNSASVTSAKGG
jgi:RNA polymerase sigma factor (sigma-70 family)